MHRSGACEMRETHVASFADHMTSSSRFHLEAILAARVMFASFPSLHGSVFETLALFSSVGIGTGRKRIEPRLLG